MKLQYVNLAGVLVLVALCAGQWRRDRDLNLEVNRLERAGHEQAAKLADQEKLIRGLNADLTQFKEQFSKSEAELNGARQKLQVADRDLRQLTTERDQLKTSVTNWAAAVTVRDERLKETVEQTRRLADELNAAILKFNELATNHNAVVKDLNELRARPARPDAAPSAQPARTP